MCKESDGREIKSSKAKMGQKPDTFSACSGEMLAVQINIGEALRNMKLNRL